MTPLFADLERLDVIIVGLQHVTGSLPPTIVAPVAWEAALLDALGREEYILVAHKSKYNLKTLVFVHLRHSQHVRRIRFAHLKCGAGTSTQVLGLYFFSSIFTIFFVKKNSSRAYV